MQSFSHWISTADRESLAALAIDAVIKSTVLLLLAAAIAGMMRRSSAAVRHRTWCLTFAGLLVLPLLSYALPAWRIPVLPPTDEPALPAAATVITVEMPAIPAEPSPFLLDQFVDHSQFPNDALMNWPQGPESHGGVLPDVVDTVAEATPGTPEPEPAMTAIEPQAERPLVTAKAVLALWLIGSVVVLFPLMVGLLHSAWLGMRARHVTDAAWTGLLDELRGRLQLRRRVTLLELTRPVIPMTWGVLRPVVVVPQAAQRWPERLRRFVLLHELAHVKRWDVPFQLLGRVACATYWFHPLAWYALRRLRIERELACDDCVVTTGERPSDYAEQLLQIVRTCRPAGLTSVGVAMARTSHLEIRIRAMFDKARSHVPLSARGARVLSIAAALLVTTVAVVRPAAREAEPVEAAAVNLDHAAVDLTTAPPEAEAIAVVDPTVAPAPPEQLCRFLGVVRDGTGKPVAGAKLDVIPNQYSRDPIEAAQTTLLTTTTDDGRFDAQYEPNDFYGTAGEMLQITAAGFGPVWLNVDQAKRSEKLEVALTADTVPIVGQILDLEGNPVAGAQISVHMVQIPGEGGLDQFLESVKTDGGSNFQFATTLFEPKLVAPVTTDQQGRFRITGIGRERVVDLELHGQGLHQARFRVMTRAGESVSPLDQEESTRGQKFGQTPVHGATFSYLAQPSRLITGIVVDAETKAPLSGINIGTLESGAHATTGADGRFVLDGCVKADEYRLLAHARAGVPYIQGSQRVVDRAGLEPLEIRFEMTHGVTVSGTVTAKDTGKPIPTTVTYWPAYPNPHLRPGVGGQEANAVGAFSHAETNRQGQFTLPVLPGPGFLCISANDREAYESANVDAAAFFRERDIPYFSLVDASNLSEPVLITAHSDASSGAMPQGQFQAIELLNIDATKIQAARSIQLVRKEAQDTSAATEVPAATLVAHSQSQQPAADAEQADEQQPVRGTVVDPAGQPVAGATIRVVRVKKSRWAGALVDTTVIDTLTTSPVGGFEIPLAQSLIGNHQNGPYWERTEIVATATGYGFGFQSLADASSNEPVQIQLSPPHGMRGRVVDLEGRPIEGATLRVLSVAVGGTSDKIDQWLEQVGKLPTSVQRNFTGRLPTIVEQTQFPRTGEAAAAAELFPILQTDADGRFELDGIGRDRVAILMLNGPGLAQAIVQVLTRPLEQSVRAAPIRPIGETMTYHGAECTVVAAPGAAATGVVRDIETHEPIAGAQVILSELSGSRYTHDGYITTTTDDAGRYELRGLPLGKGNSIKVIPVNRPYLSSLISIALPEVRDQQPVVRDVELRKAVWVTGRLYDETTGAPVQGTLHFTPLRENEYVARYSQFDAPGLTYALGNDWYYSTDADGRFRVPVTPGRGVLCAQVFGRTYSTGYGADKIADLLPKYGKDGGEGVFPTLGLLSPDYFHSLREINPPADAEEVTVDLPVSPGITQELVFVDPAGQPLSGVQVHGAQQRNDSKSKDTGRLIAVGLKEGETPSILAWQHDRKLGIKFSFTATRNAAPQTIVLRPQVMVRGRLINPQGDPLAEHTIETRGGGNNYFVHSIEGMGTDQTGTFAVGLYAGETYELLAHDDKYTVLNKALVPNVGESIDLGDLVVDPKSQDFYEAKAKHPPIVTKTADTAAATSPASATPLAETQLTQAKGGAAMPAKGRAMSAQRSGGSTATPASAEVKKIADDPQTERSYSGQVTDDAGKPLAGATIWLSLSIGEGDDGRLLRNVATSGDDGRFQFMLDPELRAAIDSAQGYWSSTLIAAAPGRGLGWFPLQVFADHPEADKRSGELKARLIKAFGEKRIAARSLVLPPADRPMRGRLVDLEGNPRANVALRVEWLRQPDISLLLRSFEEKSKQRCYDAFNATGPAWGIDRQPLQQLLPAVTTDADGRFELNGIGDDQLAALSFAGAGVESQMIHVLGRSMEPARIPHLDSYPAGSKDVFYGRDFSHVVGPSVPVEGVVKEFDSGAPVPNTLVRVERLFSEGGGSDEGQLRLDTQHLRTMTDAQGRFQIDGLPPGKGHVLVAEPPKTEPLLMMQKSISLSATDAAATAVEIQVKRVIWIEGRITDKQTSEPVNSYVDYLPLRKNPNTLDKLGLSDAFELHRYHTDSDGRYRVPGLPGPGVVHVCAINDRGYPLSVGVETVDGYDKDDSWLPTTHGYPLSNWHLVRQIDPAADAATFTCDLELSAGQKIAGTVVRPDGSAITSFSALGEVEKGPFWKLIAEGQFTVQSYDGVGPRQLFFKTPDETLVGQLRLEGPQAEDVVVTLEPAVRVTGRLIAQETKLPADRYSFYCESSSLGYFRIDDCETDDDGRFEIKGLMAGLTYEIHTANSMHFSSGKNNFPLDLSQAKPGDVVELGDVRGVKKEKMPAKPAAMMKPPAVKADSAAVAKTTAKPANAGDAPHSITVRGKVVDPDGKPAAGATVCVGYPRMGYEDGLKIRDPIRTAVGNDGSFEVAFTLSDLIDDAASLSPQHQKLLPSGVLIAAIADGFGVAWIGASERNGEDPITLQLVPDQPITGRFVSLEGTPIAGMPVRLQFLQAAPNEELQTWIDALKEGRQMWQATADLKHRTLALSVIGLDNKLVTDEDGRFRITGIGRDRIVRVMFAGPQAARKSFRMISRETDPLLTNMENSAFDGDKVYGAVSNAIVVAPSQPIIGIARDAETDTPLSGVAIESYIFAGSNRTVDRANVLRATSDAQGRFRLEGLPKGQGNVLLAVPNDGQPYFMREIAIPETAGLDPIEVPVDLHRGLWIEGKVVDLVTGAPVTATLHYLPFLDNEYASRLPEFSSRGGGSIEGGFGYQQRYSTRPDGTFRMVGLPGRAIVGAVTYESETGGSYRPGVGSELISGADSDGKFPTYNNPVNAGKHWPNVMVEINPPTDAQSVPVVLNADPGQSVRLHVTDESGASVTGYRVSGKSGSSLWSDVLTISDFDATGLAGDEIRTLLVMHIERRLGQVIRVTATDAGKQAVEARLQPLHRVRGRFLDSLGEPLAHIELTAWTEPNHDFNPMLDERPTTDSDGRFEFAGVPAGCKFRITARSKDNELFIDGINFDADQAAEIDLGDLWISDDGEVMKKPAAAPAVPAKPAA